MERQCRSAVGDFDHPVHLGVLLVGVERVEFSEARQAGQGAIGSHPFVVDHVHLFRCYHPGPSGRYSHRFGVFELRLATRDVPIAQAGST